MKTQQKQDSLISAPISLPSEWNRNRLYYGDCLTVMKQMPHNSVDLIYLDPPFNSNRDYHAIYKDETGRPLPEQIRAFSDMWTLDDDKERAIKEMPDLMLKEHKNEFGAALWEAWVNALRDTRPSMLAYLAYMVERLLYMRLLLRPKGVLYLHCDPTASHYIKVFMDGVFGHGNFRNEIIWHYSKWTNAASFFQRNHDVLLCYARGSKPYFKKLFMMTPHKERVVERGWDSNSVSGVRQLLVYDRQKASEEMKKSKYDRIVYRDENDPGTAIPDVWTDINYLSSNSKERLGYATQKPSALLERIIEASCPPDGIVLDPFCGCGTTMEAAQKLGHRWIGIDIAIHAVNRVTRVRLEERMGLEEGVDFVVDGIPSSLESATALWERDWYHFQTWAVELADGFVTTGRGPDGGVDGRLYFEEYDGAGHKKMIVSVKGGEKVGRPAVDGLGGVLARDDTADMAGLIVRKVGDDARKNMEATMKKYGYVTIDGLKYPKMQLLTVKELLDGKRFDTPPVRGKRSTGQGVLKEST